MSKDGTRHTHRCVSEFHSTSCLEANWCRCLPTAGKAGPLDKVAELPRVFGDVVEKVKLIAARILAFDTSRITGDSGIGFTPGWDSLKQIEILLAVEHEFDIRFVSVDFSELTTVSRISETVANLSQH